MNHILSLIRPTHSIKNVLVFFPLFFSGNLLAPELLLNTIMAFFSFCLTAGAVYIFNDIRDYKSDRLHPEKRNRPVASGRVNFRSARWLSAGLAVAGLLAAYTVSTSLYAILFTYLLLNIFYSWSLKKYTFPALLIVAAGYVLRVLAGAEAIGVAPSSWIIILTFLLSLLIGFNKKEIDLTLSNPDYPNRLHLQKILTLTISAVVLIIYIAWSTTAGVQLRLGSQYLWISSLFVFAGLARYAYLILAKKIRKNPVKLFIHDAVLIGSSAGWSITLFILLYL